MTQNLFLITILSFFVFSGASTWAQDNTSESALVAPSNTSKSVEPPAGAITKPTKQQLNSIKKPKKTTSDEASKALSQDSSPSK